MPIAPAIAALLLAVLATPAAAAWHPPVDGSVARPFAVTADPFAAGQHRGIDLRAAPGATVRAPCAGRVVVARRVGTSGGVVTLLCGPWRVTHLPLQAIAVRAETPIARGTRLGTLASGSAHAGLHLGVRRAGTRFGYVDPLRFLTPAPTTPVPPLGRAPRAHRTPPPHPPAVAPLADPVTSPLADRVSPPVAAPLADRVSPPFAAPLAHRIPPPLAAPLVVPVTPPFAAPSGNAAPAPRADPGGLAPWPAWLGLAFVLAGAGVRGRGALRTRTRRHIQATARLNE